VIAGLKVFVWVMTSVLAARGVALSTSPAWWQCVVGYAAVWAAVLISHVRGDVQKSSVGGSADGKEAGEC